MSVQALWNGTPLGTPATRRSRMLRLEARALPPLVAQTKVYDNSQPLASVTSQTLALDEETTDGQVAVLYIFEFPRGTFPWSDPPTNYVTSVSGLGATWTSHYASTYSPTDTSSFSFRVSVWVGTGVVAGQTTITAVSNNPQNNSMSATLFNGITGSVLSLTHDYGVTGAPFTTSLMPTSPTSVVVAGIALNWDASDVGFTETPRPWTELAGDSPRRDWFVACHENSLLAVTSRTGASSLTPPVGGGHWASVAIELERAAPPWSDWVEHTYDVNTGDGSDVLTLAATDASYTVDVRGITFYDYKETPHYGAYPAGSEWPQSAALGAFGRVYQIHLPPAGAAAEFTPAGYEAPQELLQFGFDIVNGGIVSTVDGDTWEGRRIGADVSWFIHAAYDAAHGTILSYEGFSRSVFRSVDNGRTWTALAGPSHPHSPPQTIEDITFAHGTFIATYNHNTTDVPTATDYKLAFSTDAGSTWQFTNPVASAYLTTAPFWTGSFWYTLVETYATGPVFNRGIYRSPDLVTWTAMTPPSALPGDAAPGWYLTGDQACWSDGPDHFAALVYSTASGTGTFNGTRVLRTLDGGATFTLTHPDFGSTSKYLRQTWQSPVTGTILGAVRDLTANHTTLWRSTGDGISWTYAADFLADGVSLANGTFDPAGAFYLLSDNNMLYISEDDGLTYTPMGSTASPLAYFSGSDVGDIVVVPAPRVYFNYPLPPATPNNARVHFLPVR